MRFKYESASKTMQHRTPLGAVRVVNFEKPLKHCTSGVYFTRVAPNRRPAIEDTHRPRVLPPPYGFISHTQKQVAPALALSLPLPLPLSFPCLRSTCRLSLLSFRFTCRRPWPAAGRDADSTGRLCKAAAPSVFALRVQGSGLGV